MYEHDASSSESIDDDGDDFEVRVLPSSSMPPHQNRRDSLSYNELPLQSASFVTATPVSTAMNENMNRGKKRKLISSIEQSRPKLDFRLQDLQYQGATKITHLDSSNESESDVEETNGQSIGKIDNGLSHVSLDQPSSVAPGDGMLIQPHRTWISGDWFGYCALRFYSECLQLVLWSSSAKRSEEPIWRGEFSYLQLKRFSISHHEAPYVAIMELKREEEGGSSLTFYDVLVARRHPTRIPSILSKLYGAIFVFKDQLELVRCQSLSTLSLGMISRLLHSSITYVTTFPLALSDSMDESREEEMKAIRSLFGTRSIQENGIPPSLSNTVKTSIKQISSYFTNSSVEKASPEKSMQSRQLISNETCDDKRDGDAIGRRTNRRRTLTHQENVGNEVVQLIDSPAKLTTDQLNKDVNASDSPLRTSKKSKVLLSYPYENVDGLGKITLTHGDIDRLTPGEYLNDTIIDFYMRFLWRHLEDWQQRQAHMFSSHFFTALTGGKLISAALASTHVEEHFPRVSRWTAKEDIFDKKYLFVPINDSCHWSIAVICNPGSAIIHKKKKPTRKGTNGMDFVENFDFMQETIVIDTTEDAASDTDENVELEWTKEIRMTYPPCIIFFDSLQCHPKKKICRLLCEYLHREYVARFETSNEEIVRSFEMESIKLIEPEIPLQTNSVDCGAFLLMYTAQMLTRYPAGVTCEDLKTNLSSSVTKDMFDGERHVREFRDYLSQLIFTLQKLWRRGDSESLVRDEGLAYYAVEH